MPNTSKMNYNILQNQTIEVPSKFKERGNDLVYLQEQQSLAKMQLLSQTSTKPRQGSKMRKQNNSTLRNGGPSLTTTQHVIINSSKEAINQPNIRNSANRSRFNNTTMDNYTTTQPTNTQNIMMSNQLNSHI